MNSTFNTFNGCYILQPQQIALVVVLTSILCLGSGLMLVARAETVPPTANAASTVVKEQKPLPSAVAAAVRQDLSQKVNIPPEKLKITGYTQETWSNGCLDLPRPDELCSQALVEGWRITLSDGSQTWVYRTDRQGRVFRLED